MKTSLFAAFFCSLFSAACSGVPFTVAEQADMNQAPDAGGLLAEVSSDTAPQPDANFIGLPDVATPEAAAVVPDAGAGQPEAAAAQPEASDAGAVAPNPDTGTTVPSEAAPPAPPCQPGTTDGPFAELSMAPTELDFGEVSVGGSKVLSSTLTNTGTCTTTLTASGGAIPNDNYSVLSSCNAGKVLEPGGTCMVTVTFSPTNEKEEDSVSAWQLGGQGFNVVVTGQGVQ